MSDATTSNLSKTHPRMNLKVMSDGPLRPALVQIAEAFHRERLHRLELVFGTSPVIYEKVSSGEKADVLIIQPNFIEELVRVGKLVTGKHPVIARVGLGLMARADAPSADTSTIESFKETILNAKSLIFNNVASGNYFAELLERLGIGEAVKRKVVRAESSIVFQRILQGDRNDIGVATIPLINATKGLRLIGPLPVELQSYIIYVAALMPSAASPQAASAFISFLGSHAAKVAFSDHSIE
jgi:molybdate transport system substrate-binding protein